MRDSQANRADWFKDSCKEMIIRLNEVQESMQLN